MQPLLWFFESQARVDLSLVLNLYEVNHPTDGDPVNGQRCQKSLSIQQTNKQLTILPVVTR